MHQFSLYYLLIELHGILSSSRIAEETDVDHDELREKPGDPGKLGDWRNYA